MQQKHVKPYKTLLGLLSIAAVAALVPVDAGAVTLSGGWAPFTRCPVTDPALLATDGVSTQSFCIANNSPSGTLQLGTMGVIQLGPISIGNGPTTAGNSNAQFGAAVPVGTFSGIGGVSPASGAVLADPAEVAGGLLGLMCPSNNPLITPICGLITNNTLNRVLATLESAGTPSNFDLFAALQTGAPIVTLPVKIHLQHPLLGPNCYIGSNQNPILLHPQNSVGGVPGGGYYTINGVPDPAGVLNRIDVAGATQVDSSFAVPKASGCGFGDPLTQAVVDGVINAKVGLPAAAGRNRLTLNNVTASVMLPSSVDTPVTGQAFANGWAAAITAP